MTIAGGGLKVRVKVVGQANAIGPTSIEGSFFLVFYLVIFNILVYSDFSTHFQ